MRILALIAVVIGLPLAAIILAGSILTYRTQHHSAQEKFMRGRVDLLPPDGFYQGAVTGYSGSWQGKTFSAGSNSGKNVFKKNETRVEKYPFRTYIAAGIQDSSLQVIKIDYNLAGNPWWLRRILDEIVATAPGTYLGKIHIRILPGVTVSVGYFSLQKNSGHQQNH